MARKNWKEWKEEKSRGRITSFENWKYKEGEAEVWIHTKSGIYEKGKHMIPYVKYEEMNGRKLPKLGFFVFNCHEDEEYLKYMNSKNNKRSPQHCPLDLFVEWLLYQEDIDDDEVVWECLVSKKDDKLNRKLTKHDITENWKSTFSAKNRMVIPIIDNKNPSVGICITEEAPTIGTGIFKAIQNYEKKLERANKDPNLADPDVNPYPFLWEFNAKAKFGVDEYYTVIALDDVEPTEEISELLDSEAVDLSNYVKPGNSSFLRKIMEDHIVLEDVPFDDLFANVKDEQDTSFSYGKNKDIDIEEEPKKKRTRKVKETSTTETKKKKTTKKVKPKVEEVPVPEVKEDEELVEVYSCGECGGDLPPNAEELEDCPLCGEPL